MPTPTPTRRLATELLGQDVDQFVAARRPERAWRLVARDLYEATHGAIDVTPQTLINWYGEPQQVAS